MGFSNQPEAGPSRFPMERTERFRPYGIRTRARAVEHENAVPGPSTLVLNPGLHVGSPTPEPTGGKPETSADAERTDIYTEGNRVAVSSFLPFSSSSCD